MTDTAQTPTEIIRACLTAAMAKDYDTAVTFVADDVEYTNIPMGEVRGPAGIRAVLEPFFAPTLENTFTVLREATAGPVVFLERLDRHRLPDKWVELPVMGVFEVHDGRITVWRDYFDLATIMNHWPTA